MLAAPVSALFLVLALVAFGARQHSSAGVPLRVNAIPPDPPAPIACDSMEIVVELDGAGKVRINGFELAREQLRGKLSEIYENRYVKKVYVMADSSVSYQDFVDFLSRIEGASPGLQVVLFSGELRRRQEEKAVFPCVFLSSPIRPVYPVRVVHSVRDLLKSTAR
ncbi:MAG: biopolymer transporter ExbD [Terracidiphilus sp.]